MSRYAEPRQLFEFTVAVSLSYMYACVLSSTFASRDFQHSET